MARQQPQQGVPAAPAGPRCWRPDGPGSFRAPQGVACVTDVCGRRWERTARGTRWGAEGQAPYLRWYVLVGQHGPVTEGG